MTSPSGSTPAEAVTFLDAHPEIEAFDIVLTDTNGVGRGKIVRRHELKGLYENGRHMPISILGLDITGEDVHETGLIWDSGDGDLRAWPLPGTLVPLMGTSPPRGQVLMGMYHLDGAPMSSDPRHALARQVEAFAGKARAKNRHVAPTERNAKKFRTHQAKPLGRLSLVSLVEGWFLTTKHTKHTKHTKKSDPYCTANRR